MISPLRRSMQPLSKAAAAVSAGAKANRFYICKTLSSPRIFSSTTTPNNSIRILYASQTGTAQLFAHQLAEGLEDEGVDDVSILSLDEEPPDAMFSSGDTHLLLASCAGKGEVPDNGREFYKWITSSDANIPDNCKYAVFGLGNEAAHPAHYNVVGKKIHERLEDLGGHRLQDIGLGDDGGCIEGDFDEWMQTIIDNIKEGGEDEGSSISKVESAEGKGDTLPSPSAAEAYVSSSSNAAMRLSASSKYPKVILDPPRGNVVRRDLFHLKGPNSFYSERTSKLRVVDNTLLNPDAGEAALHEIRISLRHDHSDEHNKGMQYENIKRVFNEIDVDGNGVIDPDEFIAAYKTIDGTVSIEQLEQLFMDADADGSGLLSFDEVLRVTQTPSVLSEMGNRNEGSEHYTTGDHLLIYPRNSETMVRGCISLLDVDPHAIISDSNSSSYPYPTDITVAETLSHCIDLSALPSPAFSRLIPGRKNLDYVNEIANPRRTVIDLCYEAGTQPSLEDLLYHATPMQPRYYSIASSNVTNPDEVHLVFRPLHYMTTKGYLREGVCTSFLSHKGSTCSHRDFACIPALVNSNPSFRLPGDTTIPVMFIAGGCGVAPIKAFIEERITLQAKGHQLGPATLFMGFRSPQDEPYTQLVQEALKLGALTTSDVVYSSGPSQSICQQMLVSDLIRQKGDDVWSHFKVKRGAVYMCGGARTFGAAIESAFLDIFQEKGNMSFDEAASYLRELSEEGQLQEDLA